MKEYTLVFNEMLYDTVCRVLTNYEEKADHLSAEDMYTTLVYIQNNMASAEEVEYE